MPKLYYPFEIGNDSPIPYMHEELSKNISSFDITVHSNSDEQIVDRPNVRELYIPPEGHDWRRRVRFALASLRESDLLHTGGRGKRHSRVAKLTNFRNRDLKHVHTLRIDVDPGSHRGPLTHKQRLVDMADVVTAVSEHTARTAEEHLGISPVVIYEGVNPEVFHPGHEYPDLFAEASIEGPVFLFVGAFQRRKHPGHVVQIARDHPEATFLLVGDGETYSEVSDMASHESNVIMTGRLSKSRLPPIYAHSTAFIFPSVREGCANVMLEAMASGLPVLGYDATSMPEVVDHGESGYLAEPNDIEELSTYTSKVLEENNVDAMGENARERILKHHSFEILAEQYEELYTNLI